MPSLGVELLCQINESAELRPSFLAIQFLLNTRDYADQNPHSLIDRGHCLCFVWCAVANSVYTMSIDRFHLINRQPGRPWTGAKLSR